MTQALLLARATRGLGIQPILGCVVMSTAQVRDVKASGLSARPSAWRDLRARVLRSSWSARAGGLAAALVLGAVVASALSMPLLYGVAAAAGLVVLAALWLAAPKTFSLVLAAVLIVPFAVPLGFLYTSIAWGLSPYIGDGTGGAVTLLAVIAVAAVVAARWSRGRAWLTVVLAELSVVFPGLLLLYLYPPMGLWAAALSVAVVTAVRCGAWSWAMSWLAVRRADLPRPPDGVSVAWPDGVYGFAASRCPGGFVAVGRVGVVGFSLAAATGPARESSRDGFVAPGVDMAAAALVAVRSAGLAARLTGSPRSQVSAVVLLTGSANAHVDRSVGVYVGRDGEGLAPDAVVRVLGEDVFTSFLAAGRWRGGRVRRVAALAVRRNERKRYR